MNELKANNYTQKKKLICDLFDTKKYLFQYGMLKFFVEHRVIPDKVS